MGPRWTGSMRSTSWDLHSCDQAGVRRRTNVPDSPKSHKSAPPNSNEPELEAAASSPGIPPPGHYSGNRPGVIWNPSSFKLRARRFPCSAVPACRQAEEWQSRGRWAPFSGIGVSISIGCAQMSELQKPLRKAACAGGGSRLLESIGELLEDPGPESSAPQACDESLSCRHSIAIRSSWFRLSAIP
jgi:hypothetical protein